MKYEINEETLNTLQLLDSMTFNHCVRCCEIAREIEAKFELPDNLLSQAALVHDIGKIYISSKILQKPGRLSPLERQIIDLHPYIGFKILQDLKIEPMICEVVLKHHGNAAPTLEECTLSGDAQVRYWAKMLHTIDAFEALTTDRAYRRGFSQAKAVEIMDKESNHDKNVLDFLHTHSFYEVK